MQCPKCVKQALKQRKDRHSQVVVDFCPDCQGFWFDRDELNSVMSVASKDLEAPSTSGQSDRNCPRCQVAMQAFNYPQTQVQIDMCPNCQGLWLDADEFKEIKAVRQHWKKQGKLDSDAAGGGIKGKLIEWVNKLAEVLPDEG